MADTNPVVSALADYLKINPNLIRDIQFNPKLTASEVTAQVGIKFKESMEYLETNVNFLDGAGCDRNTPTDTTTFSQKEIEVAEIDISENLCMAKLEKKWTQIWMKKGTTAGKQDFPSVFAEEYWAQKEVLLAQALDTADWQGKTTSLVENLNKYNGWIYHVEAGSAVVGNTGGITTVTTSNVIAAIQGMILVIPDEISDRTDLTLYLPHTIYRMYGMALINANLFHFKGSDGEEKVFGTDIRIRPTYGLKGLQRMFITYPENLYIGMDGEGDTQFTSRLDPSSLKRWFVDASFKRGTQVAKPELVVDFDTTVS